MDNEIIVTYQKIDFQCCICLEMIHLPVIQCSSGSHFICPDCSLKIKGKKCPICRVSPLFFNRFLERQILNLFQQCEYCELSYFKPIDSHINECTYGPTQCLFCREVVSSKELKQHLTEDCQELKWIEKKTNNTLGSLDFIENVELTRKGVKIRLVELNANFCLILNYAIVICKYDEYGWRVAFINKSNLQLDLYFKTEKNRIYKKETIVTVNSFKSLREASANINELPLIPKEAEICKFEIDNDDNISICSSGTFFSSLFE